MRDYEPDEIPQAADDLLAMMGRRRVARTFTTRPVSDGQPRQVTEAARWATSYGNRHLHKYLVVRDPVKIRLVRSMAPGMLTEPLALVVILTDTEQVEAECVEVDHDAAGWIDIATAAMSMTMVVQALEFGSCPVTAFSRSGVSVMLDLPAHLQPEFILVLGHPVPTPRVVRANGAGPRPVAARDPTYWDRVGIHERYGLVMVIPLAHVVRDEPGEGLAFYSIPRRR